MFILIVCFSICCSAVDLPLICYALIIKIFVYKPQGDLPYPGAFYYFSCQIKSNTQQLVFHWGKHEVFKHSMKYTAVFCDYNYIPYQMSMNMSAPPPPGHNIIIDRCIMPKCSQFNLFYFNLSHFTQLLILVKYIINAGVHWLIKMAFSGKCSKHVLSSIFLCRSGTEEDYSVLSQLLDDISTYRRDCIEAKQIEKERNKKKEEADRNKLSI